VEASVKPTPPVKRPFFLKCHACGFKVPLTLEQYWEVPLKLRSGGVEVCPHCGASDYHIFQRGMLYDMTWRFWS
jgi:hypothetical protein